MSKSIMQVEKRCFISGRTDALERYHCFGGNPNRKLSEKYGLWVWLNHWHQNEPPAGAHHNKEVMDYLHREGQKRFEEIHGSRDDFMRIFGRNFL